MFRIACIPALCLLLACGGTNGDEITVTEVVKTDEELRREVIELGLADQLNDPSRFEFVSLELKFLETLGDNIESRRDIANMSYVPEAEQRLFNHVLDSLERVHAADLNKPTGWSYVVKYRDTNANGALVLNETFVKVDGESPSFAVVGFTTDLMKLLQDIGPIPNWDDIFDSVIRRLDDETEDDFSVSDMMR